MKPITRIALENDASPDRESIRHLSDEVFQDYMLQGVSRTFALTIPQLPQELVQVVSNAYLLCRTIDTIEDEPHLTIIEKKDFSAKFVAVISGEMDADDFAQALYPRLSTQTSQAEKELIYFLPRVIALLSSFDTPQRRALASCVKTMAKGMVTYQLDVSRKGLKDLKAHNSYCYHVAGVVGEMLTELFCHYNSAIAEKKTELMELSVSFGQGLQMTNILKDMWDDWERGVSWLPRDVFEKVGFDLGQMQPENTSEAFKEGVKHLLGIAHFHLKNALQYTLLIPAREEGIRRFCLWALGMAILTLKKIYRNLEYTSAQEVKISRKTVKTIIACSNIMVKHDLLLKGMFLMAGSGIPIVRASH